jgi:hypothetical protein
MIRSSGPAALLQSKLAFAGAGGAFAGAARAGIQYPDKATARKATEVHRKNDEKFFTISSSFIRCYDFRRLTICRAPGTLPARGTGINDSCLYSL